MLTLPNRGYDPRTRRAYTPRRTWLAAFWLALMSTATLALVVSAAVAGRPDLAAGAAGGGMLLAAGGCLRPLSVVVAYKAWNRLASSYAYLCRTCLLGICFAIVRAARVGCDDRLALAGSERSSLWTPFGPAATHHSIAVDDGTTHWARALAARAALHGDRWILWLVPFMLLLERARDEEDLAAPAGIYTLF